MKRWLFILIPWLQLLHAQPAKNCIPKDPPVVNINFGAGEVDDNNVGAPGIYRRVASSCPTDGHYTYTSYTSDCFRGDWITLEQDHTGDNHGNMLLVNAAYEGGEFFNTVVQGLEPGKTYEFAVWMLNVCKPSDKCPFPLLPNIQVTLATMSGKGVAELNTGNLPRYGSAQWTRFAITFDLPVGANSLLVSMSDQHPGGCGNDFAVDDITFRECIPPPPPVVTKKKVIVAKPPVTTKAPTQKPATTTTTTAKPPAPKPATTTKTNPPVVKKSTPPAPTKKAPSKASVSTETAKADSIQTKPISKPSSTAMRPPPTILTTRKNSLVKTFQVDEGDIRIDLYDNGEIDGDTVTVYHNNSLLVSHAGLSQKAITFHVNINKASPHHELVMVADNLGSIPPNTSLMVVTAGGNRYEVFISSSEQNNAKVVFDLRE